MDNLRGEIHFILTAEHNDLSLIPHGRSSPHKFSALHTCTVAQPLPPQKKDFQKEVFLGRHEKTAAWLLTSGEYVPGGHLWYEVKRAMSLVTLLM